MEEKVQERRIEGKEASTEIVLMVKEYIYRKLTDFPEFLNMYGEEWIDNQIEKNIQGVSFVGSELIRSGKDKCFGYVREGSPYIFLGEDEKTVSEILQNPKIMNTILHEGIHKVLEEEGRIGCFYTNDKQGKALNEGLTQWMVMKMNGTIREDSYFPYTNMIQTLERFIGTDKVLELTKGDGSVLEQAFQLDKAYLLVEQLDTALDLERNIREEKRIMKDLQKIIDYTIEGTDGHEKTVDFYKTIAKLENSRFYKQAKKSMTAVEGTLEGYEACESFLKKELDEKTKEKYQLWAKSQQPFIENFLEPQYQSLIANGKHRDIKGFQKLAISIANFMEAMQNEYIVPQQPIALYHFNDRVEQNASLMELKKKTEELKEKWEAEILEEISNNRKKTKKMATSITELGELIKTVKWNLQDESWMDKVVEALDIQENKEDMSGLFQYVYKKGDLANIKDYSLSYRKGNRVMIQKKKKPIEIVEDGFYDESSTLENVEEKEKILDFTLPIGVEEQVYIENFDAFSNWIKSREHDCQIKIGQRTIIVEHEGGAFTYYTFDEKGQVVPLEQEEGKEDLRYEEQKKEKHSWKDRFNKVGEWFKQRFTSKSSVKLLAENTQVQTSAMKRKKFLFDLKTEIKPMQTNCKVLEGEKQTEEEREK